MSPDDPGTELERIPGVLAATVFQDRQTGPQVYLTVESGADFDAIRQTCHTLLRNRGIPARRDHIHIGTAPTRRPAQKGFPSVSLDALEVHSTANRLECIVHLRGPTRTVTGSATEPDTPAGRARAVARATLAAIEIIDPDLRLGLHGTSRHDLFGFDALTVLVEASRGRTHAQLPGVQIVDRSVEQAAALATLQALRNWTP